MSDNSAGQTAAVRATCPGRAGRASRIGGLAQAAQVLGRRHRREPASRGDRARRARSRSDLGQPARRLWPIQTPPISSPTASETEIGRVRLPLAQYPHLRRAIRDRRGDDRRWGRGGVGRGGGRCGRRQRRLPGPHRPQAGRRAARAVPTAPRRRSWLRRRSGSGTLAASLLGIVLRGAKALEPLRERTRRVTLPDLREERRVRAIERYRAFIDSASDGIIVLDAAGVVLYMNRAAEEVTGYARDGLAGSRSRRSSRSRFAPGSRPTHRARDRAPSRSTTSTSSWSPPRAIASSCRWRRSPSSPSTRRRSSRSATSRWRAISSASCAARASS